MNITPVGSYVLLKKRKEQDKPGKIIITNSSIDPYPHQGIVISNGSDCKKTWCPNTIVRHQAHAAQTVNEEYLLVNEEQIIAIIGE